ncbi:MAG: dienelactone hydrolase family protein [Candidatus Neomarinimicrobiota bacterium]|nr:dienelactone hydrolase family protein [Candidatus Neomarinimicrobiota bacterium]
MIRYIFIVMLSVVIAQETNKETITFNSANPFSFEEIIMDLENQEVQEVFGILTLPNNYNPDEKYPLIIGVAGSLNWGTHHLEYLKMYHEMGFATFQLQSFDSRDVQSTVGSQVEVTTAMVILDSYRALEALSTHPNIDTDRSGITGWSLGGGVSLYSAWLPLIDAINNREFMFAAHLPVYPGCMAYPYPNENMQFSTAPIHILIGELDNWVPAAACTELIDKIHASGLPHNIDITIYENAHHSFDRVSEVTVNEKGYTLGDCRFPMNEEGTLLLSEYWNIPINTPLRQKLALMTCAGRGPSMGGNAEAREQSFKFSAEFFTKYLKE